MKNPDTKVVEALLSTLSAAGIHLSDKPLTRETLVATVQALVVDTAATREKNAILRAALKAAL